MYDYIWDSETGGYLLTTGTGKFVANEIRPAFAQELALTGLNRRLRFDPQEERPFYGRRRTLTIITAQKSRNVRIQHTDNP